MCQLVPSKNRVDLPKIFGFDGLCAVVPSSLDVSAIFPDLEVADGNASNVAPPSSDMGDWPWRFLVGMFLRFELLVICIQ